MNCNTTHYRANSSSVPGDPTQHPNKHLFYGKGDSHWRNLAAQIAGDAVGERLQRYEFVQAAVKNNPYSTKPGRRDDGFKADDLRVVSDASGKLYDDVAGAPIIVTGDSYASYGLNRGSQFSGQVAYNAGMPVTLFWKEGLWGSMPVELAQRHQREKFLDGRKVIVYSFIARAFTEGSWPLVNLDQPFTGEKAQIKNVVATGAIREASPAPTVDAPYNDYIQKFHVRDMVDEKGHAIANSEGVVRIRTMKDKQILPHAALKRGDKVKLTLTSWEFVEKDHGKIMTGTLANPDTELKLNHYWGELRE